MLNLYYSPGACSLASHIILEESGLPYQIHKVDLKTHTIDGKDYYQINPQGLVPALVLENGNLLTQNIAIMTYAAEVKPEKKLLPPAGTAEHACCYEWLAFVSADIHKAFTPIFAAHRWLQTEAAKQELIQSATQNINRLMALADKKLAGKNYALGDQFTVPDAYLFVMYSWAEKMKFPVTDWPNYSALVKRVKERPAVQKVLAQEGLK